MRAASLLLILLSSGLYALSFPPWSLSLLAWVALAPLFVAASWVSPGCAALYGLLWGVVAAYGVGWWLPAMVSQYLQVSPVLGWVSFFVVSVSLAGVYFGGFAAWLSWIVRRQGANPLLIAAGWGVCEFARANLFVGNPWALSGYSQIAHSSLMQSADATGPYGVGMLLAAVNACVAGLFAPVLRGKRPVNSLVGVCAVLAATLLYGEWRLTQTFTSNEALSVAVIQAAVAPQLRGDPEYRDANLTRYLTLTREAAATHPALIFWPEYAVDFSLQQDSPLRAAVFSVARDLGADLILGAQHAEYGVADLHYHNSVFLIRRGTLAGRYDKTRLLPFAEVNQFARLFPRIHDRYEPGHRVQVLRATNIRVGAFVCFEAMYPSLVREFARLGADVLANPSNDGWFGAAAPARHALEIASVRAIENRRYLVRATTTGISAVIDPYGHVVTASEFGAPAVLTAPIYRSRAQTPYQHWGDMVAWIALTGTCCASLRRTGWMRRTSSHWFGPRSPDAMPVAHDDV